MWPASPLSPQPCLRAPAYDSLGLQGTSRRALGSSSLAPGSVSVAAAPGPLPYQASQPGQPAAFTAPLPAPAPDKLCRVYSTGERLQQADQLAPLPPHSRPRSYSGSGGSSAAGLSLPAGVSLPVSVPARLRPLLVTPPTSPASMMPEGGQAGMPTGLWQARAQIIRQQGSGEGACGGSGAGGEEVLLLDTRYGLPAAVGGESGGAGESAGEEAGGGQVACAGAAAGGHYALLRQAAALLSHSRGSANHLAFNVHAVHAVQVCVWGGGREQCAGVCVGGRSHAVHGGSCRCNRVCGGHTATGGGSLGFGACVIIVALTHLNLNLTDPTLILTVFTDPTLILPQRASWCRGGNPVISAGRAHAGGQAGLHPNYQGGGRPDCTLIYPGGGRPGCTLTTRGGAGRTAP